VTDLARAHRAALEHHRAGGRSVTLNCGYGRGYSVLEVADAVRRAAGRDLPLRMAPRRPGDPASIVADAARIRELLQWRPQLSVLDTIVGLALSWVRRLAARAGAGSHPA
jgi:UDP-glucose 4-epimerase